MLDILYHYNKLTGDVGECHADASKDNARGCPFGGTDDHFESSIIAHKAYESFMSDYTVANALRRTGNFEKLKEMNADDLFEELKSVTSEDPDVVSSVSLATVVHKNQIRRSRGEFTTLPYVEHPLRNAVRVSRWGVKDNYGEDAESLLKEAMSRASDEELGSLVAHIVKHMETVEKRSKIKNLMKTGQVDDILMDDLMAKEKELHGRVDALVVEIDSFFESVQQMIDEETKQKVNVQAIQLLAG